MPTDPAPSSRRPWWMLLARQLPLEHETALFVLVSVLDFFMTYWLLMHRSDDGNQALFAESNPVAAYFLHSWGPFRGMLMFKLAVVTLVCIVSQIIALQRLHTARWLLNLGTAVTSLVVVYSLTVYLRGLDY